jgi:hypothetical protein
VVFAGELPADRAGEPGESLLVDHKARYRMEPFEAVGAPPKERKFLRSSDPFLREDRSPVTTTGVSPEHSDDGDLRPTTKESHLLPAFENYVTSRRATCHFERCT